MARSRGVAHGSRGIGVQLNGLVRPGVEALLLAAVALGCAQAGWSLLSPGSANASNSTSLEGLLEPTQETVEVRSPFAPDATGAGSHLAETLLSSVQLKGIRMSTDESRSGAMFTLADQNQRAFMVGQEVVDGVVLSDVEATYVLLSYDGGQHRVDLTAAPSFSFARAMMGLEQVAGGEQSEIAAPSSELASVETVLSAADQAWLLRTLGHVETREGQSSGWRVSDPPEAVTRAGLRAGDLVVGVNGVGAGNLTGLAAAMQSNTVVLEVEREGDLITISMEAGDRT